MAKTIYPLRGALTNILMSLVMTSGIDAINNDLATRTISQNWPQFTKAQVIKGEPMAFSEQGIYVYMATGTTGIVATQSLMPVFLTNIQLILPVAGPYSRPADFETIGEIFTDNIRDLLTSSANYNIEPVNPSTGNNVLPKGSSYTDCYITREYRIPFKKSVEGVVQAPSWILVHHAVMNPFSADRFEPVS